jgi:hypothetical protein
MRATCYRSSGASVYLSRVELLLLLIRPPLPKLLNGIL